MCSSTWRVTVYLGTLGFSMLGCSQKDPTQGSPSSVATTATSSESAVVTCENAGARYAKSLSAMLLGDTAPAGARDASSKILEPAITRTCQAEKWDAKVVRCLADAKDAVDSEGCLESLGKATQDKLDQAVAQALADARSATANANSMPTANASASATQIGSSTTPPAAPQLGSKNAKPNESKAGRIAPTSQPPPHPSPKNLPDTPF